jgi:hypothetical protein
VANVPSHQSKPFKKRKEMVLKVKESKIHELSWGGKEIDRYS